MGNHYADIPLQQRIGLAVAVENALPEAKAVCDYLTCSNIDDGVASAIEKSSLRKDDEFRKNVKQLIARSMIFSEMKIMH